jgi:hypothetical protein
VANPQRYNWIWGRNKRKDRDSTEALTLSNLNSFTLPYPVAKMALSAQITTELRSRLG